MRSRVVTSRGYAARWDDPFLSATTGGSHPCVTVPAIADSRRRTAARANGRSRPRCARRMCSSGGTKEQRARRAAARRRKARDVAAAKADRVAGRRIPIRARNRAVDIDTDTRKQLREVHGVLETAIAAAGQNRRGAGRWRFRPRRVEIANGRPCDRMQDPRSGRASRPVAWHPAGARPRRRPRCGFVPRRVPRQSSVPRGRPQARLRRERLPPRRVICQGRRLPTRECSTTSWKQ